MSRAPTCQWWPHTSALPLDAARTCTRSSMPLCVSFVLYLGEGGANAVSHGTPLKRRPSLSPPLPLPPHSLSIFHVNHQRYWHSKLESSETTKRSGTQRKHAHTWRGVCFLMSYPPLDAAATKQKNANRSITEVNVVAHPRGGPPEDGASARRVAARIVLSCGHVPTAVPGEGSQPNVSVPPLQFTCLTTPYSPPRFPVLPR